MVTHAQRDEVLRTLGYASYDDYLAGDLWKSLRRRVFERDHYLCRLCDRGGYVVYYLSYSMKVLGGHDLGCLTTLCHKCHDVVEFSGGKRKRTLGESVALYHTLLARKAREEGKDRIEVIPGKVYTPGFKAPSKRRCTTCGSMMGKKRRPCGYCRNQLKVETYRPLGLDD